MGPLKKMLEVEWLEEDKFTNKPTAKEKRLIMAKRTVIIWDNIGEDVIRSG